MSQTLVPATSTTASRGTGRIICSVFNTQNVDDIQVAQGLPGQTERPYAYHNTDEGDFISLRAEYGSVPRGRYTTRFERVKSDQTGDWFAFGVQFPRRQFDPIGAIRFRRQDRDVPASFADNGSTWTEYWDNNAKLLYPVPVWGASVSVLANG